MMSEEASETEEQLERRLQICSGQWRGRETDDSFVAAREDGRLVEVEAVNPWRVLHRFYGNVRPLPPCQTSGARDIANLFPLLVRRSREGGMGDP